MNIEYQLPSGANFERDREYSGSFTSSIGTAVLGSFTQPPGFVVIEDIYWISMNNLLYHSLSAEPAETRGYSQTLQSAEEYSIVLNRIHELRVDVQGTIDDDYGAVEPSSEAFHFARKLIIWTYAIMGNAFTRAAVSVSFEGGIRIEWLFPFASVRAIVPAEEKGRRYIYFELGEDYKIVELSAENLAACLLAILK